MIKKGLEACFIRWIASTSHWVIEKLMDGSNVMNEEGKERKRSSLIIEIGIFTKQVLLLC
jgi:hypothetical protein